MRPSSRVAVKAACRPVGTLALCRVVGSYTSQPSSRQTFRAQHRTLLFRSRRAISTLSSARAHWECNLLAALALPLLQRACGDGGGHAALRGRLPPLSGTAITTEQHGNFSGARRRRCGRARGRRCGALRSLTQSTRALALRLTRAQRCRLHVEHAETTLEALGAVPRAALRPLQLRGQASSSRGQAWRSDGTAKLALSSSTAHASHFEP